MTDRQARNLENKMSDSIFVAEAPFRHLENGWLPKREQIIGWAALRASRYASKYYRERTVESLLPLFDGKGIGGIQTVPSSFHEGIFAGLRDGLFGLTSYRDYCGAPRGYDEFLTVELTDKGMRFFDSIPRMELAEVWE